MHTANSSLSYVPIIVGTLVSRVVMPNACSLAGLLVAPIQAIPDLQQGVRDSRTTTYGEEIVPLGRVSRIDEYSVLVYSTYSIMCLL